MKIFRPLSLLLALCAAVAVVAACPGPNHNHEVGPARTARQAAAPLPGISCPVCGKPVDGSIYVSVKNGAQRVYTCTSDHAKTLYNSPLSYHIEEPQAGEADLTPLAPATQCPFCTMDAVKGHELQFMGNQSIHACSMTPHFNMLFKESDLKASFSGIVPLPSDVPLEPTSSAAAGATDASASSSSSTVPIARAFVVAGSLLSALLL